MGILRLASEESKRIPLDESDWIEVKSEVSKKTFNKMVAVMPTAVEKDGLTPVMATEFQSSLFDLLVTGWSLPQEPTVENYESLDIDAARAVDDKLMEYFSELTVGASDAKKPQKSRGT